MVPWIPKAERSGPARVRTLTVALMPPATHKDYSATPLTTKLGIKEGSRILVVSAPRDFVLGPLPSGARILRRARRGVDVAVLFATRRSGLEARVAGLAGALEPNGRLWVAWPKRATKLDTDLSFDVVQRIGLVAGLVDNKSASIDDVFQGMQFVYRLKDRVGR